MLAKILNAIVRVNFFLQLVVSAALILAIDATYALRIHEGQRPQPPWLIVAIPITVTLLWLTVASVALLLTWRDCISRSTHLPGEGDHGDVENERQRLKQM